MEIDSIIRKPMFIHEGEFGGATGPCPFPDAELAPGWDSVLDLMRHVRACYALDFTLTNDQVAREYCETVIAIEQTLTDAFDQLEPHLIYAGAFLTETEIFMAQRAGWVGPPLDAKLLDEAKIKLICAEYFEKVRQQRVSKEKPEPH